MQRSSGRYTVSAEQLATFKASWPCHGIPDNIETITFEFESHGDLVDVYGRDASGAYQYAGNWDGPALLALSHDAQTWLANN